jgi:hypothetical protein
MLWRIGREMTLAVAWKWLITTRKTNFAMANNRRVDELQGNRILTYVKTVEGTYL